MHPIYGYRNGDIEFRGSSFCIEIAGKNYLITANHVLKDQAIGANLICFDGLIQSIPSDKSATYRHSNIDIAVARLTKKICETPLQFDRFDSFHYQEQEHALIGYPATRFSVKQDSSKYEIRAALSKPDISLNNKLPDNKVHFACPFSRKNAIFSNGMKGIFSDPHGMSGGPALFLDETSTSIEKYGLAGVITDLHPMRRSYIRCTRSEIIIEAIEQIETYLQFPKQQ